MEKQSEFHHSEGQWEEDPRVDKIKRKVDLRLSAILALMYIVNQIDRTNLPNAYVHLSRL